MEWHKTRGAAAIDLCRSGITPRPLTDLDLRLEDLELSGNDVYGYPPLLEKIAGRYGVETANVVTTLGTSNGIFVTCSALLSTGDRVAVERPAYEPVRAVPEAFEPAVVRFERRHDTGWTIDPDEFEAALPDGTSLILLTNPHNPTGQFLADDEVIRLAERAAAKGAWLLIDEVYRGFLDGKRATTAFGLADNILVSSSLGKVYGLGDLRCGWVLAPPDLAERMRRIIDYINVEGVFIGERTATLAFDRLDALRELDRPLVEGNRELVADFMRTAVARGWLSWVEPPGGVIIFPRIEIPMSGDELAAIVLRDFDTALTPGSFFEAPDHFRLGFAGDPGELATGLEYVGRVLEAGAAD
jgi:aspartate/methionine/tyrosine aminotransferase